MCAVTVSEEEIPLHEKDLKETKNDHFGQPNEENLVDLIRPSMIDDGEKLIDGRTSIHSSFNVDCVESSAEIIARICDAIEKRSVMISVEEIPVHKRNHKETTNNSSGELIEESFIDTREVESVVVRPLVVDDREEPIDGSTCMKSSAEIIASSCDAVEMRAVMVSEEELLGHERNNKDTAIHSSGELNEESLVDTREAESLDATTRITNSTIHSSFHSDCVELSAEILASICDAVEMHPVTVSEKENILHELNQKVTTGTNDSDYSSGVVDEREKLIDGSASIHSSCNSECMDSSAEILASICDAVGLMRAVPVSEEETLLHERNNKDTAILSSGELNEESLVDTREVESVDDRVKLLGGSASTRITNSTIDSSFHSDCVESSAEILASICDAVEMHPVTVSEMENISHELNQKVTTNDSDYISGGENLDNLDAMEPVSVAIRPAAVEDSAKIINGSTSITTCIIVPQEILTQNNRYISTDFNIGDTSNPIFAESCENTHGVQKPINDINTCSTVSEMTIICSDSGKDLVENMLIPSEHQKELAMEGSLEELTIKCDDETLNIREQRITHVSRNDSISESEEMEDLINKSGTDEENDPSEQKTAKHFHESASDDIKERVVTLEESSKLQDRVHESTIEASKHDVEFLEDDDDKSFGVASSNMDLLETSIESFSSIKKLDTKECQITTITSCVGNVNTEESESMVELSESAFTLQRDVHENSIETSVSVSALKYSNTEECDSVVEESNATVFDNSNVDPKNLFEADVEKFCLKESEAVVMANDNADAKYLNTESFIKGNDNSPICGNSNIEDGEYSVEAIETSTTADTDNSNMNEHKSLVGFNSNDHENLVDANCSNLHVQIPSPVSQHHNPTETTYTYNSFVDESNTGKYKSSIEFSDNTRVISKSNLEVSTCENSNIQVCKRTVESSDVSDVEKIDHTANDGTSCSNTVKVSNSEKQLVIAENNDNSLDFENPDVEKCNITSDSSEHSSLVENISTQISAGDENSNIEEFKNSGPSDNDSPLEHSNRFEEHENSVESDDNITYLEKSSIEEQQNSDGKIMNLATAFTSVENSHNEGIRQSFEAANSIPCLDNLNVEVHADVFGNTVSDTNFFVEESNIEERKNLVQISDSSSLDENSLESDEKCFQVESLVEKLVNMIETDDFIEKQIVDEHESVVETIGNTSNVKSSLEEKDYATTIDCDVDSNIEECNRHQYIESNEDKAKITKMDNCPGTVENGDSNCTQSEMEEDAVNSNSHSNEISLTVCSKIEAALEDIQITPSKQIFAIAPPSRKVIENHRLVNRAFLNEENFIEESLTRNVNIDLSKGQKAIIENINCRTTSEEITRNITVPIGDNTKHSLEDENLFVSLEVSPKERLTAEDYSISTKDVIPKEHSFEDMQEYSVAIAMGSKRITPAEKKQDACTLDVKFDSSEVTETINNHKSGMTSCPEKPMRMNQNLLKAESKLEADEVSYSKRDAVPPKVDNINVVSRNNTFPTDHCHYRDKITPESVFDITSTVQQSATDHLFGENHLRKEPNRSWTRKEQTVDDVPEAEIKRIDSSCVLTSEVFRLSKKEKTCQQECTIDYSPHKGRSSIVDCRPGNSSGMVGRKVRRFFSDSKPKDEVADDQVQVPDDVPNTVTNKDHKLDSSEEKEKIKVEVDNSTLEVEKSNNCSDDKEDADKETGDNERNSNDRSKGAEASDHKGKRKFSSSSDSSSSQKSRSPSPEERVHKKRPTSSTSDSSSDEKERSRPKSGSKNKRHEIPNLDGGDLLDAKSIKKEKEETVPDREVFSEVRKDEPPKRTADDHPMETSDSLDKEADLKRNVEKEKPPQVIKIHTRKLSLSGNKENDRDANAENSDAKVPRKRKWGAFTKAVPKALPSISTESLKDLIPDYKPVVSAAPVIDESPYEMPPIEEETVVMEEKLPVILPKPPPKIHHSSNFISEDKHKVVPHEEILPPSPPKNPMTCIVHIRNLTRPFTVTQLKAELGKTGTLVEDGFWIDKIKSKCYVTYETEEQAAATRQTLHGARWPTSNPKSLTVDFSTKEELDFHKELGDAPMPKPELFIDIQKDVRHVNQETHLMPETRRPLEKEERTRKRDKEKSREVPMREWDRDKLTQDIPTNDERGGKDRNRDKERSKDRREKTEKKESKKKHEEETPAKLLDDLFRKTKTTPCIYWLPLTEEQREEAKKHREEEREKRRQRINQEEKDVQETDRRQRQRERDNRSVRDRETSRRSRSRSRSPGRRR